MSEDNFGILQDAPKVSGPTCCCGIFNKRQMKHFAVFWILGALSIAILLGIPYLQYKMLPKPQTSASAGMLRFSEERYVFSTPYPGIIL